MKVVLFTKKHKPTVTEVVEYLGAQFEQFALYEGKVGDAFPGEAEIGSQDILISYISPWIIPNNVLTKTKLWNINFHPGPPEYPGTGCSNFAIYNQERSYGVTCHLMEEKVDTGKILAIERFPLLPCDSVYSLTIKSYGYMLSLFYKVIDFVIEKKKIPICGETWKRKPYTRKELEELCRINVHMAKREVEKRIRATSYPNMPGAYIELFNNRFEYNPDR